MKVVLMFILLFILKTIKSYPRKGIPALPTPLPPAMESDIILAPGGYKGVYMLGICHYLKNNFSISNKSILGISCGSFNALFMRLNPELDNQYLQILFGLEHTKKLPMHRFVSSVVNTIQKKFVYEDFDFQQTNIGVTTYKGLEFYNEFSSLGDVINCCCSSSFIPFLTHRELIFFYKNKVTFDGAIYYKRLKKRIHKKTLLITSSMFGRFNEKIMQGMQKPTCSYYELYLKGYHDARNHHKYFSTYFTPSLVPVHNLLS